MILIGLFDTSVSFRFQNLPGTYFSRYGGLYGLYGDLIIVCLLQIDIYKFTRNWGWLLFGIDFKKLLLCAPEYTNVVQYTYTNLECKWPIKQVKAPLLTLKMYYKYSYQTNVCVEGRNRKKYAKDIFQKVIKEPSLS